MLMPRLAVVLVGTTAGMEASPLIDTGEPDLGDSKVGKLVGNKFGYCGIGTPTPPTDEAATPAPPVTDPAVWWRCAALAAATTCVAEQMSAAPKEGASETVVDTVDVVDKDTLVDVMELPVWSASPQ